MEPSTDSDTIQNTIVKLRSDGLIDPNHKIIHKSSRMKRPDFRAIRIRRSIYFYGDCSKLSTEELMFCFLHEESHLKYPQNRTSYVQMFWAIMTMMIVGFAWSLINGANREMVYLFLFPLSLMTLTVLYRKRLMADEIGADYHASLVLREQYGIKRPSIYVGKVLMKVGLNETKMGAVDRILLRLIGTHPSPSKRVNLVRERVDLSWFSDSP